MPPLISASWRRRDSSAGSPFRSAALGAQTISSVTTAGSSGLSTTNQGSGHGDSSALTDSTTSSGTSSSASGTSTPTDTDGDRGGRAGSTISGSSSAISSTTKSKVTTPTPTPTDKGGGGGFLGGGNLSPARSAVTTNPPLPASTGSVGSGILDSGSIPQTGQETENTQPASADTGSLGNAKTVPVQVADNLPSAPPASDTSQPVFTTEIFPTIVPTTFTSNGEISTGFQTVTSSRVAQTSPTPGSSTSTSSNAHNIVTSPTTIVGIAIGGAVFLALLVALFIFLCRRRRRFQREMDITNHTITPNPDLFRPVPGTGWDVESASNRSSSASASSDSTVKPMAEAGSRLTIRRKPVPGLLPMPAGSGDPFCGPSNGREFDQVPITPEHIHVTGASVAAHNPFADPVLPTAVPPRGFEI